MKNDGSVSPRRDIHTVFSTVIPNYRFLTLGLILAWIFLFVDFGIWRSPTDPESVFASTGAVYFFSASLVIFIICALAPKKMNSFLSSKGATPVVIALGIIAPLLIIVCKPDATIIPLGREIRSLMFIFGHILCGVEGAILTLKCATVYKGLSAGEVFYFSLLSELVVFLVACVVLAFSNFPIYENGPSWSGIIALCVLPAFAWIGMKQNISAEDGKVTPPHHPSAVQKANLESIRGLMNLKPLKEKSQSNPPLTSIFLALFILCTIAAIVRNCTSIILTVQDSQALIEMSLFVRGCIVIILLVACFTVLRRIPLEKFFLATAAGIAFCVTLTSLLGQASMLLSLINICCFWLFDLICWCLMIFIVNTYDVNVLRVFAFGRGITCLGNLIGFAFGSSSFAMILLSSNKLPSAILIICALTGVIILANQRNVMGVFEYVGANFDSSKFAKDTKEKAIVAKEANWKKACELVGNRAQLTEREQEILFYVSRGRTAKEISSSLYISLTTARTHMRNVYSKLDIHSKEELSDLVKSEYEKLKQENK